MDSDTLTATTTGNLGVNIGSPKPFTGGNQGTMAVDIDMTPSVPGVTDKLCVQTRINSTRLVY